MGMKLPENELALYKAIDLLLWEYWDPIGINAHDKARNEYQTYLPQIFQRVKSRNSSLQLSFYLYKLCKEDMGLSGGWKTAIHNFQTARKLMGERKKHLDGK